MFNDRPQGKQCVLFSRDRQWTLRVEGKKKTSLFSLGPVVKCFVIPFQLKNRRKNDVSSLLQSLLFGWHTNLPRFQGARPDHVRVKNPSCCFPSKLVCFGRPRELDSLNHDTWHVLVQSKTLFGLGGITMKFQVQCNPFLSWLFWPAVAPFNLAYFSYLFCYFHKFCEINALT